MPASLTICRGQILAILSASTVYGVLDDPERRTVDEINNALEAHDAMIVEAIYETPGHPLLSTYKTSTTLVHGASLPVRVGDILSVMVGGKAAKLYPVNEIELERTNAQTLTLIEPHYNIEGERIFHNGATTATVDYIPVFTPTAGVLQSPTAYQPAVIAGALAEIQMKEGHHVDAAAYWGRQWQMYLQMIRSGARSVPDIQGVAA